MSRTAPQTLIRIREVVNMTGISKSQVYRLAGMDAFPKPIRLTAQSVAWVKAEIEQWIQSKIAQRNKQEGSEI